jgi:heme/copper-type cytochrome/quinol oxidase subunit 2
MTKDWMQVGIFMFVAGMIAYLVVMHTGQGEGQVKADIVWTAFISIFATKIIDFAFKIKSVKNGKDKQ